MANTFKNASVAGVGTSPATVYTAPSATTTVVLGMALCNVTTGTVAVSVTFTDGGSSRKILKDVDVPAGSTLEVLSGQKYILEATDTLIVESDTASGVDVTMGVMEIT